MGTPLYNTDIIPMTSRPTLTVMDDGDYFVILDTSTGKISKILRTNIQKALNISYDNTTSGLTAETVQAALDELVVNLGSSDSAILALSGRLDTLEGTGEGSVAKAIDDAVSPLAEVVDNNRLYSDSQYLDLKAKYEAQQIALNASKAELYTDDPILQYGAVEIIGDGYEADDTRIDVSANVVDGKLSMEQKGLTITQLVKNGDFTSSDLSKFVPGQATVNRVNEIIELTPNDISPLPNYRYIGNKCVSGEKYLVFARVKGNSNTQSITVLYRDWDANIQIGANNVTTNLTEYQVISGIGTLANSGNAGGTQVVFNQDSVSSPVVYIDYMGAYNLTALGLDHITDTDILADLLPYVDGTKNVGKMGVRVVGKNLFDNYNNKLVAGTINATTGVNESSLYRCRTPNFIPVAPSSAYIVKANVSGWRSRLVLFYDNAYNFISFVSSYDASFTTPSSCVYIKIVFSDSTESVVSTQAIIDSINSATMLNLGSSALPYTPYQEQLTFLAAIGNSLPNGVADSIKTVADGWEHVKRMSTPVSVASGVAVNTTNYPTAKNGGQWVNELTAGGTEIGVVGMDSTTGAGMLRFELATPIVTKYDLPIPTSGKTIHRFAGEEKIALYGTGLTFSENVLTVLSAIKFVAGEMTDITDLATIIDDTVTFSGVSATDVVYVKVEHDVDRPLGILEHTPAVSNTASRLASLEARVTALEV